MAHDISRSGASHVSASCWMTLQKPFRRCRFLNMGSTTTLSHSIVCICIMCIYIHICIWYVLIHLLYVYVCYLIIYIYIYIHTIMIYIYICIYTYYRYVCNIYIYIHDLGAAIPPKMADLRILSRMIPIHGNRWSHLPRCDANLWSRGILHFDS